MNFLKNIGQRWRALCLIFLAGCAGMERDCSSCSAQAYGANWLIVQYNYNGEAIQCWKLMNTSVSNEEHSDGIYWKSPGGHLVHLSGWYNRVQINGTDFESAAKDMHVDLTKCSQ